MSRFEPQRSLELTQGRLGYRQLLEFDFKEAEAENALGNAANSLVLEDAKCIILGLDQAADSLLDRACEWVLISIEKDERPDRYEPGWTQASRYHTLEVLSISR